MTPNACDTKDQFGIADISICLGQEAVDLAWLEGQQFLTAARAADIRQNGTSGYFRSANKTPEHLAIEAINGLLEQTGVRARDIQFLLFTSTVFETTALHPDLVAQRIARAVGCLNVKAFSFQHVHCVSPLAAMKLLKAYFAHSTGPTQAIIVCADAVGNKTEHLRAIESSGVHSDGAAAILVTNTKAAFKISDADYFTNVSRFLGQTSDGTLVASPMYFAMVAKLIRNMLHRNNISENAKIDLFTNNLDFNAWLGIGKVLGIPSERIHFNHHSGHVFGADPFINLKNNVGPKVEYCVLAATAIAGTVGAAILKSKQDAQ